jgi:hypothetical protein
MRDALDREVDVRHVAECGRHVAQHSGIPLAPSRDRHDRRDGEAHPVLRLGQRAEGAEPPSQPCRAPFEPAGHLLGVHGDANAGGPRVGQVQQRRHVVILGGDAEPYRSRPVVRFDVGDGRRE